MNRFPQAILCALLLLCALPVISHAQMPAGEDTNSVEYSPLQHIRILRTYNNPLDRYEVWLVDAHNSENVFLLDTSLFRFAELRFSTDERWLAVNVEFVSDYRTIVLFRRASGVAFTEVKDAKITDKVVNLLTRTEHLRRVPGFFHSLTKILSWLPDSRAFLLTFDGWDDEGGTSVGDWECIYDVETGKASIDFKKYFHGEVHRHK